MPKDPRQQVDYPFTYSEGYSIVKKKKPKVSKFPSAFPTGIDDGKGAQKLLLTYIDEVLDRKKPERPTELLDNIEDGYHSSSFLAQVNHPQLADIPMLSQIARQEAIWPNHTTEKRELFKDICKRLTRNDGQMIRLRLSSESVDDELATQIAHSLTNNKFLKMLQLHDNVITDEGVYHLCFALRWHPGIQILWLGANQISDQGARHLSNLLRRNPNIKELNICNKWPEESWSKAEQVVHPCITYIGAEFFAKQLLQSCALTSLDLGNQRLRDAGTIAIFKSLKPSLLRVLSLKGNHITDDACIAICDALTDKIVLEKLDLSHNHIGDKGSTLIAKGLSKNDILQALDLEYNQIDKHGMDALLKSLESNNVIGTLIVSNNKCKDNKVELIVEYRSAGMQALDSHPFRSNESDDYSLGIINENDEFGMSYEIAPRQTSRGGIISRIQSPFTGTPARSSIVPAVGSRGGRPNSRSSSPLRMGSASSEGRLLSPFAATRKDEGRLMSPMTPNMLTPMSSSMSMEFFSESGLGSSSRDSPTSREGSISRGFVNETEEITSVGGFHENDTRMDWRNNLGSANNLPHNFQETMQNSNLSLKEKKELYKKQLKKFAEIFLPYTIGKRDFSNEAEEKPLLSVDLGRRLGPPKLYSMGVMPIRSATSRFRDSGNHLAYLRISTPDDPPDVRPYSIFQIEKDNIATRKKLLLERQDPDYQFAKWSYFQDYNKVYLQKAAMKPPPEEFKQYWKKKMRYQYPKGIDKAKGCTSTRVKHDIQDDSKDISNIDNIMNQILEAREGGVEIQDNKSKKKLAPVVPPKKAKNHAAEALANRRKEKLRQIERDKELVKQNKDPLQKEVRNLIGLRSDQLSTDYITFEDGSPKKKHLTTEAGVHRPKPFIKHDS